jgi:hypothetical protein
VFVEVPAWPTAANHSENLGAMQNTQYIAAGLTGTTDAERPDERPDLRKDESKRTDLEANDALVFERSTLLRRSRMSAWVVVTFFETASVTAPFRPSVAPPAFTLDSPPLTIVLRL